MTDKYFSNLLPILSDRTKLAVTSWFKFANVPLNRHLDEVFSRPFGEPGAFLGDPAFEAVFGWETSDKTMSDLSGGLLTKDLVEGMANPPREFQDEYQFPKNRHPYSHQVESWEILSRESSESLIVASGTGSGKTECFMVPILDRLVRQRTQQDSKLTGVRALFLYPLNALINSQRERLVAWIEGFRGDIRFCLYNGNTPERLPAGERRKYLSEVVDRKTLRSSPPPILVTNASMLEYMLVRTQDKPILDQSQGKLEWIVLDEAHSYVGSQAAEAALLIRRVLFAFGVTPEQVRFVATSATIGDPNGEAGKKLKEFLAQVAGVSAERVHLVAGERSIPQLPDVISQGKTALQELCSLESNQDAYEVLCKDQTARKIRAQFVADPTKPLVAKLSDVVSLISEDKEPKRKNQHEALQWIDLLSGTSDSNGQSYLPLRSHFFHQTMSGLWACADSTCVKRNGFLSDPDWHFGQVFTDPRKHCDCLSPVYELVTCTACGTVHLLGGITDDGHVVHFQANKASDEFELEADEVNGTEDETDDEVIESGSQSKLLIVNQQLDESEPLDIDRESRLSGDPGENSVRVFASEDKGEGLSCPFCSEKESNSSGLFQSFRVGAPYLLDSILPTLLEFAPDGNDVMNTPWRGRKLLTFNDSRQGTARLAANLQQNSERSRVRSLIYHLTLRDSKNGSPARRTELLNLIEQLVHANSAVPNPQLDKLISDNRGELDKLDEPAPVGFFKLAQELAGQGSDFPEMLARYKRYAPSVYSQNNGPETLAKTFLVREFGRRPKRLNNLETMGLVSTSYPRISSIVRVPNAVLEASGFSIEQWHNFLKICMDFFVRAGGSLEIQNDWRKWLGMPFPQSFLVSRKEDKTAKNQRRWPEAKRGRVKSTLVRLLSYVLVADPLDPEGQDRINTLLDSAWDDLRDNGLLIQNDSGFTMPLEALSFIPIQSGWMCPVTRRILDVTLKGVTPYLPLVAGKATAECEQVEIPIYDPPFAGETDPLKQISKGREWVLGNASVVNLRQRNLWPDLNDRVIELSPYFTTAEHSAQLDSKTLKRYEDDFKKGKINLLSCSTTMEMGIDIGGISMVAMNNVPPHPANYLQRAGRAGRRREARSVAMTLCKSNQHDQSVFANSRWAFDTLLPAPRVALDSPVIVERHVNSFLLSHFLKDQLRGTGNDQTKLTCGMFFLDEPVKSEEFESWCRDFDPQTNQKLASGIQMLLRQSVYDGQNPKTLTDKAAESIHRIAAMWRQEWSRLVAEETELLSQDEGEGSAAVKAVRVHKDRAKGEYLLGELASRGFLPAYGFPTDVAPFDNLTVSEFLQRFSNTSESREDNRFKRRELASRSLSTALREYAPGSEIVIDGRMYRSAGVTLNWHVPADQDQVKELQNIKTAWICKNCGESGSTSFTSDLSCDRCGTQIPMQGRSEFLQPAGFSVDFYSEPSNDLSTQHFVPVEEPWINANGDWQKLPNPELGRFRVTTRGHIYNQSKGIFGKGYALCLECGRAEPMSTRDELPQGFTKPHRKLRRTRDDSPTCPGSNSPWKIKRGIALGTEGRTDMVEIQLKNASGVWLNDKVIARTLAVAIRDALAGLLGVQANELGCEIKESKIEDGSLCKSILVFDHFAAGYSSRAEDSIEKLFHISANHLDCPSGCDSACPKCVLDYDQRFAVDALDRKKALSFLSPIWLDKLRLPEEYAFFGSGSSRLEGKPLSEAIWNAVVKGNVYKIKLYAGGDVANWDIGISPIRTLAYRLAVQNVKVEVILPETSIKRVSDIDRYTLASLAGHDDIEIRTIEETPSVGTGFLIAEALRSDGALKWAVCDSVSLEPSLQWGRPEILIKGDNGVPNELRTGIVTTQELLPKSEPGDLLVSITTETNGPLPSFGTRLWNTILQNESSVKGRLEDPTESIVEVTYSDRYLFDPLSVTLLVKFVEALRAIVGTSRWSSSQISILTAERPDFESNYYPNMLWHNWPDMQHRNNVLIGLFHNASLHADLKIRTKQQLAHDRSLIIKLSSGKTVHIGLDQGMGAWRNIQSNEHVFKKFDFSRTTTDQIAALCARSVNISANETGTKMILSTR